MRYDAVYQVIRERMADPDDHPTTDDIITATLIVCHRAVDKGGRAEQQILALIEEAR